MGRRTRRTWLRLHAGGRAARDLGNDLARAASRAVFAPDQVGDQPGPSGLVRGAKPGAVIAVEVFAEEQVVTPRRAGLQLLGAAEARSAAVGVAREERDEPVAQVDRDLVQGQLATRSGRVLDGQV